MNQRSKIHHDGYQQSIDRLLNSARGVPELNDFQSQSKEIFEQCRKITGASLGFIALISENRKQYEVIYIDPEGFEHSNLHEEKILISGLSQKAYKTNKSSYDNNFSSKDFNLFLPQGFLRRCRR